MHAVLTRCRIDRATGEPLRRYEHDHPGAAFLLLLAAPLARLELEVGLEALFSRYPGPALAVPPAELEWRSAFRSRSLARAPGAAVLKCGTVGGGG